MLVLFFKFCCLLDQVLILALMILYVILHGALNLLNVGVEVGDNIFTLPRLLLLDLKMLFSELLVLRSVFTSDLLVLLLDKVCFCVSILVL